jgi:GT2 family glycosyltransferase
VHNALEETLACLDSINAKTEIDYFLTVVDDASDPPVGLHLQRVVESNPHWRLLRNNINKGYTKSANYGLREARADWVVLLNSDTLVTRNWLDGLLDCSRSDPNVRAVGPLSNAATIQSIPEMRDDLGNFVFNELPVGVSPDDIGRLLRRHTLCSFPRTPMLNGFCLLLHRPTVEALGLLDECNFPVGYGEETDLCLRLTHEGYTLAIADHVYVHHAKSASFGSERVKQLQQRSAETLGALWPGYSYRYIADVAEEIAPIQELREALRTTDLKGCLSAQ